MSYIGNQPPDIGAYDVESFDGGGTSFTLKRTATVSSVLLFIDGVRQTPTDAYTVSGVTLTTTATTPSGTDNVTVMFMGDVVDIGAPSADTVSTVKIQDDAVTTAQINDDAVTAAKLANAINTDIAANTAKVTNATHTGDVTGATALTIATDAVDIAMLSATGTADATTFLRGDNSWAATSSPALSHVSQWCLTAEVAGTAAPITASLAEVARDGYARVGSAMTESSGAFTFPATGIWRIDAQFVCQIISNGNFRYGRGAIFVTTNDTDWDQAANASGSHTDSSSYDEGAAQISITHIFDVTNTSTHKVRFHITQDSTSTYLLGNAGYTHTNFIFSKLGDT